MEPWFVEAAETGGEAEAPRLESCQARTAAAKELEGQNARREPLLACCDGLLGVG